MFLRESLIPLANIIGANDLFKQSAIVPGCQLLTIKALCSWQAYLKGKLKQTNSSHQFRQGHRLRGAKLEHFKYVHQRLDKINKHTEF